MFRGDAATVIADFNGEITIGGFAADQNPAILGVAQRVFHQVDKDLFKLEGIDAETRVCGVYIYLQLHFLIFQHGAQDELDIIKEGGQVYFFEIDGVILFQADERLLVESGHKLTLTKDLTIQGDRSILQGYPLVRVASGSTLDLKNHTITSDLDSDKGVSEFILESGATLIIGHEDGISSYSHPNGNGYRIGYGAIQTNSADYSSGANYHFDGDSYQDASSNRVQFSGCFYTDLDPTQHRVHDLIILNDRGLDLCPDFQPLEISGSVSPSANTDPNTEWGWVRGGETLPVTLSYFNAVFNGFDSVTMQWETQTETNNLGFYILRSTEPDATSATVISSLIVATNSSQGAVYSYKDDSLNDDGVYYYWLQDVSFAGEIELHGPAMAQVTLNGGGNHSPDIPLKTGFMRNYPNPFNPSTQLEYYLEEGSDVGFKVYNLKGQLVDQITLRNQAGGFHRYTWEPQLSSGVYLIKFTADGKSNTRRVMLSK